ncbi:hypothetical protein D3C73_1196570 [compost metagenome]
MDHQQQALAAIDHGRQQRAQQRAVGEVEAALGLFGQLFEGLGVGDIGLPQQRLLGQVAVAGEHVAVLHGERKAQGVVVQHQRL